MEGIDEEKGIVIYKVVEKKMDEIIDESCEDMGVKRV